MKQTRSWILALCVGCISATIVWTLIAFQQKMVPEDLYPLWYGAKQFFGGRPIYGPAALQDLKAAWHPVYIPNQEAGNGYPFPLILLLSPLSLLSYHAAIGLLMGLMIPLLVGSTIVLWGPDYDRLLCIAVSPMFFQDYANGNVTGILTACIFVALVLWYHGKIVPALWLFAVAALKPQTGLLFFLIAYGIAYTNAETRTKALYYPLLGLGSLLVLSFMVYPMWVRDWLLQLPRFTAAIQPRSYFPWGLCMLIAAWKRPWYVWAALLTAVLFPINGWYALSPLMLYWLHRGGKRAILMVALSWLAYSVVAWWYIYPLLICAFGCWDLGKGVSYADARETRGQKSLLPENPSGIGR